MESNIYKIMSGMLKPVSTKKNKSKVDDKQISLWRDDIIDVNKINNPNGNSKTDFGDFALNEEIKEVVQKNVNETITENNNDSVITFDKEQDINQENVSENIFEENLADFYDDSKEDTPVSINYSNSNNFFEEPKEEYSDFENNIIIEEERLRQEQIKKEKIEQERLAQEKIERERLEQERLAQEQIKQERLAQEEKKRQEQIELNKRKLEEQRVKEELERQRKLEEERILMEQKRQDNLGYDSSNTDLDEYERYDVKVLERIMNDARNPEYATERERILNLWKHLIALAPADKRGVAEILVEGQVKAVGNHEFVIIYNQSAICNQVMSRKFKRVSLKLLFDLLGGDYNYFAITNEVWFMKRTEYSEQYSIGTKYPTLTPIDDPRLKVNNDLERDETEEAIKQMHDIFGSSINIKKRG